MKRTISEATVKKIYEMLAERFGEPIGDVKDLGPGVADERDGHLHRGTSSKNNGWGSELHEDKKHVDPKTHKACPICKGTGKVLNQRGKKMACVLCKGHGILRVASEQEPENINETTCQGCGSMMPMEGVACDQCGMMPMSMDEADDLDQMKMGIAGGYGDSGGYGSRGVERCEDCNRPLSPGETHGGRNVCGNCAFNVTTDRHDLDMYGGGSGTMDESEGGGRHPGHASSCTCPDCSRPVLHDDEGLDELDQVAPPGRERQVKALKKVKGVKNPFAVAWASYNKGK